MGKLPLEGIRIADFTWFGVGPYGTLMLTLLGAESIKIGSGTRATMASGFHPLSGARPRAANLRELDMGKRSVALNLSKPEGRRLAFQIVMISDMVAENFRPGAMERMGLGYETLRQVRPDIIMVSASACGQTGPESRSAGYAPIFAALSGLSFITGYPDGPPVELRHSMDMVSGLNAATGTLVALNYRLRTGRGQHVDAANRELLSCFMGEVLLDYIFNGRVQGRRGNEDEVIAPHNVYPCKGEDRWVSIAISNDQEWKAFCKAVGKPEWLEDRRFADQYSRWQHRKELDQAIALWTSNYTPYEVMEQLQGAGVAAVPSMSAQDLYQDPHLNQRGAFPRVAVPEVGEVPVVGAPWKSSKTPAHVSSAGPGLGQDKEHVFGELLGLPKREIERLVELEVLV